MEKQKGIEIVGPGEVLVGRNTSIGNNVRAIFSQPATITLADYVTIGDNSRFIVESGDIFVDDWSTIHNDSTILSKRGVAIGQNCWFGQSTVIDGTGGMTIENGVRVGMYSQLWSHVAAGEQIEGCTLFGEYPSHLGEDVWLVGTCFLASGVSVGRRTIALAGSNITKDCPPFSVLAGAPAQVKGGLSFYRDIDIDEKMSLLLRWLRDFAEARELGDKAVTGKSDRIEVRGPGGEKIVFHKSSATFAEAIASNDANTTNCCVETKRYEKSFTRLEGQVLKFLSGNKARFCRV